MTTPLEIRPLDGAGAEILGVDVTQMTIGDWDQIQAAFAAFGVVFFRDQIVTESEHIEFARRWGRINVNRFFAAHEFYPEIALVVKNPDDANNIVTITSNGPDRQPGTQDDVPQAVATQ